MKSKILVLLAVGLGAMAVGCSGDDAGPAQKTTTQADAVKATGQKPGMHLGGGDARAKTGAVNE